ncbi:MAG: PorT family protein [Bacteroidales bacterium]|nr:PorT family protein [Bacteroidales bacterium]
MKKIVTLLSAALVLLASAPAFAQASVGAGYFNSIDVVKSGSTTNSDPLSGFYAGVGFTVPVASGINFTPGVYYGYAAKSNATDLIITKLSGKREDHFINVPLHFSYGLDLSPDFRFFAYAGPSVSLGVASKVTSSVGTSSGSYDRYQENSDLNRFDILVGGGVGVEIMNMFRLNIGYDMGMLNRYNNTNTAYRRNQLTAGVAFLF